jgi:hypothetical protein
VVLLGNVAIHSEVEGAGAEIFAIFEYLGVAAYVLSALFEHKGFIQVALLA